MSVDESPDLLGRLSGVLKRWVTPILKPEGFSKSRLNYVADVGPVSWCINIQRSAWNSVKRLEFTLNCGVHVPGVIAAMSNRPPRKNVILPECSVYVRVGMLTDPRRDKWWVMEATQESSPVDSSIGGEVRGLIENQCLPFLRELTTPRQVAELLVRSPEWARFCDPMNRPVRLEYAATIYHLMAEYDVQRELMDEAVRLASESPVEGFLDSVILMRDRLNERSKR